MKNRRRIIHTTALIASSLATMLPGAQVKAGQIKEAKKARVAQPGPDGEAAASEVGEPPDYSAILERMATALASFVPELMPVNPIRMQPTAEPPALPVVELYPWKEEIVTTTFWIGEKPTKYNPVPNHMSAWDKRWAKSYGGTDNPDPARRHNFHPDNFIPKLNPFYIALPYNDLEEMGHKPEAAKVIPWFKDEYKGRGISVLKSRWVAIRYKDRVAYAQWEDCGPFRTDHAAYVFGDERPRPNVNKGAGLDVSPAVRDFLGMKDTDVTDWRFVEMEEIPDGPWKRYGDNNHFVQERRADRSRVALEAQIRPGGG